MKKRLLAALLAVCLVAVALSSGTLTASAAEIASGTCGDSLTWRLEDNGVLTISGSGAMKDYQSIRSPWNSSNLISSVIISDGVTSIGMGAFSRCTNLTHVILPESITSLGDSAFAACNSLTDINIPNSVTYIGDYAFWNCANLTDATIPDGITEIDYQTFFGCRNLVSIDIPKSVTQIGNNAFGNCESLRNTICPRPSGSCWNRAKSPRRNMRRFVGTTPKFSSRTAGTFGDIRDRIPGRSVVCWSR